MYSGNVMYEYAPCVVHYESASYQGIRFMVEVDEVILVVPK